MIATHNMTTLMHHSRMHIIQMSSTYSPNFAMNYMTYPITLAVLLIIDSIWLTVIAKNTYAHALGAFMATDINWLAAILFYVLFSVGIVLFVVKPSLQQNSWLKSVQLGLLFGLICYATYDLTNLATIKNWPLSITIIDLIWGSCLTAITALISYSISKKLPVKH